MPTAQEFESEVSHILETAAKARVTLRLMGSIAFRRHCSTYGSLIERMNRALTDIDLVGYSSQRDKIVQLFERIDYTYDIETYIETAFVGRLIFWKKTTKNLHVDVFLDQLSFCHMIDFKHRLEVEDETIPLAEMFLEKMQIVKLDEKDLKDTVVLLLEHDLGDTDTEMININHIAKLLSKDWGFYYTVNQNLQKLSSYLASSDVLEDSEKENVRKKIAQATEMIDKSPKSLGWKIRARIGTSQKWYQDVEEAERKSV